MNEDKYEELNEVAAKFELEKLEAEMKDGLLHLFIPIAESKKAKTIKIK